MNATPNALCFGDGLPGAGCLVWQRCRQRVSPMGGIAAHWSKVWPLQRCRSGRPEGWIHDQLGVVGTGSLAGHSMRKIPLIVAFRRAAPLELTAHLDRAAKRVRRAYGIVIVPCGDCRRVVDWPGTVVLVRV